MNSDGIIDDVFLSLIASKLNEAAYDWLQARAALIRETGNQNQLSMTFAQIPRFTSGELLGNEHKVIEAVLAVLPGYDIRDWTVEALCRVWLLTQIPDNNEEAYLKLIDSLFTGAELNELVALYKALPLLKFPERWISRCEEGIRSNIGPVLESIMYHNPYPAAHLSEAAWNQMILKAFFTDKDVNQVFGLKERHNPALRATLADYVQERLAAGRTVNPEIYNLMTDKVYKR